MAGWLRLPGFSILPESDIFEYHWENFNKEQIWYAGLCRNNSQYGKQRGTMDYGAAGKTI